MTDYQAKFKEVTALNIDGQAKFFLTRFVLDFQGNFEEILDLAEDFKKFANDEKNTNCPKDREMNEFVAHLFLERKGETLTVKALRDYLTEIDLDKNNNVAFIEYALWKYKKTLAELFKPSGASPELIEALNKAIEAFQQALAIRKVREEKMAELERTAALGGVKGMAAKNQLDQMKAEDVLAQNKREINSAAAKRKAQKAVDNDDGSAAREKALKEEAERLEAERIAKEEADRKAKADSRDRLKAKASLWGNQPS
jgi:hypothetical protein